MEGKTEQQTRDKVGTVKYNSQIRCEKEYLKRKKETLNIL